MSRTNIMHKLHALGFPRVSGDEPVFITLTFPVSSFSPRERG